ncbi:MAG: hypothetical protein A2521_14840 [Deltaproteobacteria bacterium RIFOXYD12_FULL_57_12]|nr:MAG: hypothetical protein A2521_14840 [Deltaproteobacteria bacterium RIFOXYD12_FULL_57_12]
MACGGHAECFTWEPVAAESEYRANLQRHVRCLAEEIGERNMGRYKQLQAAAAMIKANWQGQGYQVRQQVYTVRGQQVANLEIEIAGISAPEEIVLVGAHYDSVVGSPGANDNGTGVAVLLELSRLLAGVRPARTVRFVAFVNEEPPFFLGPAMGSMVYAEAARQQGLRIVAMLSLETMGYYANTPGSQHYPFPFGLFYPDTANFIAFVANLGSWRLGREAVTLFRAHSSMPAEWTAAPSLLPGIGWSDHWSFWRMGWPAIMITDTALYRDPHYHTATDTWARLDYERLARVTMGLAPVIAGLAGAETEEGKRAGEIR